MKKTIQQLSLDYVKLTRRGMKCAARDKLMVIECRIIALEKRNANKATAVSRS